MKSSIFLASINEEEVNDIILNLDNHKSNDISPKLLKSLSGTFSRILTYLFNLCISSGVVFPDELKVGKIVPLYKTGNKSVMSKYRPISILPTISKIFEKLLHKRIYQFFQRNEVIHDNQFDFRKGHSTIHAIQTAVSSVVTSLNSSYQSMGIFIDFSKAFDTIKHSVLLDKLRHCGIRGTALKLIRDYLTNRKQYVFYDISVILTFVMFQLVFPKAVSLDPYFYIIYVNDIINSTDSSVRFILFADDTNVFITADGGTIHESKQST